MTTFITKETTHIKLFSLEEQKGIINLVSIFNQLFCAFHVYIRVGKITEKAVCRSIFDNFRLPFQRFCPLGSNKELVRK